jgi:signal transduction histidine kinase
MTVLKRENVRSFAKKLLQPPVFSRPMHLDFLQLNFLLMYFIYGLAFFSMGLAMALEVSRSPDVAEATLLKPLAVFGFLNAISQWLEIVILPAVWQEIAIPKPLLLTKLLFLTLSFAALTAFGVQAYRPARRRVAASLYVSLGFILVYTIVIGINHIIPWKSPPNCLRCADALARYLLALPGAMLAALALKNHALKHKATHASLAKSYRLAAWGFALFGLAQLFPGRAEIYPAPFINAELFREITGIPIQLVSTLLALFTMGNLIHASHLAEKGRQRELHQAQLEKFAALEQVQSELLKRRELRKDLFRHIVLAQEEERSRISRELHDDTAQILTAASLNMAALKTVVGNDPKATTLLERSQELCQEMSQALYRMVHDLRPAQLDDFGLVPALRHLTEEKWFSRKIAISFEAMGDQRRLDPMIETVLFRVAQEALTNVLRHAHTDSASLRIFFEKDQITLTVADKGAGFTPGLKGQGFGLAGISERVELINGRLEIDSAPGKGTTITVVAPARPHRIIPPEPEAEPSPAPPTA